MGRAGIFEEDARLELLEGEIYEMSPIGSPHAACFQFISALLNNLFNGKLIVSTQDPIRIDDLSEPQPDITHSPPVFRKLRAAVGVDGVPGLPRPPIPSSYSLRRHNKTERLRTTFGYHHRRSLDRHLSNLARRELGRVVIKL